MKNELMSISEVSIALKIKESTIRYLVRKGMIPNVKIGRCVRFHRNQIDNWIEKRTRYEAIRLNQNDGGVS